MAVKFSVVIPTHNRLNLLTDAVRSVLRHSDVDFEIIVFDNGSQDPIKAFVAGLGDRRVRFARSEDFLPVTDSWNQAIDLAAGDYVTLIGDDDGLGVGYFERASTIIDQFAKPDLIYSGFYQFFHPGVHPGELGGYVDVTRNAGFFGQGDTPTLVTPQQKDHAVAGSLNMKRNFVYNMQAMMFARRFLDDLRVEGVVFHSPFPDYYLANVALAKGARIVADPVPTAIAGVSRKSFGFTLFNNEEARGAKLLKTDLESDPLIEICSRHLLPGPSYNTNFIVTMAHVHNVLGQAAPCPVNFGRYRRLQIFSFIRSQSALLKWWTAQGGENLLKTLTSGERAWATGVNVVYKLKQRGRWRWRWLDRTFGRILPYDPPPTGARRFTGDFADLPQLLDEFERAADPARRTPSAILADGRPTPSLQERTDWTASPIPLDGETIYCPPPSLAESAKTSGVSPRLLVLPKAEPWVYGAAVPIADHLSPNRRWIVVSVAASSERFGVGVLDRAGGRFLTRAGVMEAATPLEVWLVVDPAEDCGDLVFLNWDQPRTEPLVVTAISIVAQPASEAVRETRSNEAPDSFWIELDAETA